MPSPNLGIAHVQESQAQKHVTVNGGIDELDKATQGATALTISGNKTVTATEFTGGFSLELSGTPGAAFDLNIPATRRSFRVSNGTDGIATVQVTGGAGAGVQVPVGESRYLYSDGADVTEEGSGSGGGSSGVQTQEDGTQVVASSTTLDFDGDGFNLADGGSGKTTIELADQSLETRLNNTGGDQNIGASRTQVQWDNEIRDEGAWHDPATNNERIVIGTEIVDVHCEITLLNLASADVEARVARYSSADALQEVVTKEITQGASITLQAMNVRGGAAGDYLVVDLLSSDASYDVDGSESYFMVRRARAGGGGGGGSLAWSLLDEHNFADTPASEFLVTGIDVHSQLLVLGTDLDAVTISSIIAYLSTDGGSTVLNSAGDYHRQATAPGTFDIGGDNDEAFIMNGSPQAAGGHCRFILENMGAASIRTSWSGRGANDSGNNAFEFGMTAVAAVHDAIKFVHNNGTNLNAGIIQVFGR